MKKAKLFLLTLCLISVLALLASCGGENYNEGFSVKTPERATATATDGVSSPTDGASGATGTAGATATAAPTPTPTMEEDELGEEVLLPTPSEEVTDATGNNSEAPATDATATATPEITNKPVEQVTPAEKTGINLPPIWFK